MSLYDFDNRDPDRDGIEDTLKWDAYPESTAFVQIGLLHYHKALQYHHNNK